MTGGIPQTLASFRDCKVGTPSVLFSGGMRLFGRIGIRVVEKAFEMITTQVVVRTAQV